MNKSNAGEYLPLVQALAEGRLIQEWCNVQQRWCECLEADFAIAPVMYRIKPEPREIWVNEYAKTHPGYCYFYNSEIEAKNALGNGGETRLYREVIE